VIGIFGLWLTKFLRRWIAVGMDSSLAIIHNTIINVRVLIYREFFQQDVDEFGFEEAGTDQIIDPGLTVD